MASPGEHTLTFLRGSGFRLDLVGVWDLLADASGRWPSQRGFVIFNETKITAVIERDQETRRGFEGTYAVEGHRLLVTKLVVDTAPGQGPLGNAEFAIDGDTLTITWLSPHPATNAPPHIDTLRRRGQPGGESVLLPPVAIYGSDAPPAASR